MGKVLLYAGLAVATVATAGMAAPAFFASAGATALAGAGAAVGSYGLAAAALGVSAGLMSEQGAQQQQIAPVGQVADKTTPQAAEQLDAARLGEEESEKRKRKSAKEKFKIKKEAKADTGTAPTTGVTIDSDPTKVTGVQI